MSKTILITGATGYIGGRLLKKLENKGYVLRCFVRDGAILKARFKDVEFEVVEGDIFDPKSIEDALKGVDAAFYLIHSMGSKKGCFEELDKKAAENFASASQKVGLKKLIYLGGLGDDRQGKLSKHLKSRHEVGEILRSSGSKVIEFRASIILGSGSLSYELMKALVEKLPIMVTPNWVGTKLQPIFIDDALEYLTQAIELKLNDHLVVSIGGKDIINFKELMLAYAKIKKLKRFVIVLNVLTPYLSALWLGLITPIYARVGRKLIESILNETVVIETEPLKHFKVQPIGVEEALKKCIEREEEDIIQTRWCDSLSSGGRHVEAKSYKSRIVDPHVVYIKAKASKVFKVLSALDTNATWYVKLMWNLRGAIDLLVGGVGTRRGRRRKQELCLGDFLSFWRVVGIEKNRKITLKAEMKVPGRAFLSYEIEEHSEGVKLIQSVIFDPTGLFGYIYWYIFFPFHFLLFRAEGYRIKQLCEKSCE